MLLGCLALLFKLRAVQVGVVRAEEAGHDEEVSEGGAECDLVRDVGREDSHLFHEDGRLHVREKVGNGFRESWDVHDAGGDLEHLYEELELLVKGKFVDRVEEGFKQLVEDREEVHSEEGLVLWEWLHGCEEVAGDGKAENADFVGFVFDTPIDAINEHLEAFRG